MTYTEVQRKGSKEYYYRVKSVRENGKVKKARKYLGKGLSKDELRKREEEADILLGSSLNRLLSSAEIKSLEELKHIQAKQPKVTLQNRYERFLAQFTYDSNAIEGSTLSLQETAAIIFENITPKGKTPREVNEAINHRKAFDYMLWYKGEIDKKFICNIQRIIITNTLKEELENQTGTYREVQVFIRGANFVPPKPEEVPREMRKLLYWQKRNSKKLHPLILAAYFHAAFESVHPFVDGNGRTGRLLINFTLHRNGYPMVNVPNAEKLEYYECLEEARKGNLRRLVRFLYGLLMSTN